MARAPKDKRRTAGRGSPREELAELEPVAEPEVLEASEEPEAESEEELEPNEAELAAVEPSLESWDVIDAPVEAVVEEKAALVPAPARQIARYDPLQIYLNQARAYPLLTPEDEHTLAVRYLETGDVEVARKLVTSNLRLVVKIAHEYRKAYRNLLDLVQEGNVGLMHAVKKFDPYRGVRLSSYAAWWIRAYILKFILANWRLVKIGTTQGQRKLFFNLRKEMDRLEAMGISDPGPKLLAEKLDLPEGEVASMQQRLAASDLSLDSPLREGESGSSSRLDFVSDRTAGPDRAVENREFSELLREKLLAFGATLSGRDREIFDLRTMAEEPLTLQDIGDRYGITRERARQIERRMMDRLRDFLRQELGDAVDVALERGE